jgi:hypothetical protein
MRRNNPQRAGPTNAKSPRGALNLSPGTAQHTGFPHLPDSYGGLVSRRGGRAFFFSTSSAEKIPGCKMPVFLCFPFPFWGEQAHGMKNLASKMESLEF